MSLQLKVIAIDLPGTTNCCGVQQLSLMCTPPKKSEIRWNQKYTLFLHHFAWCTRDSVRQTANLCDPCANQASVAGGEQQALDHVLVLGKVQPAH